MNRITELFQNKKDGILSIFATAGFPERDNTMDVLEVLQENGVDLIELGMPFSDPLADGPVIQNSSSVAIEKGMDLKTLFHQIEGFRSKIKVPVILMGYVNTVMQYGIEKFCKKCEEVGIDGVILPDLPFFEYQSTYKSLFDQHGLLNVFLITPQTSEERIKMLDQASEGFLYLVSSASTTGSTKVMNNVEDYLARIQGLKLKSNSLVGFNIKDKKSYQMACKYSDGAIIGSAFIKAIDPKEASGDLKKDISNFVSSIR